MKRSAHCVRLIFVAIIASLCAPTFQAQTPDELDSTARARIEQARASIVIVREESNESSQPVSQAVGFIRSDRWL